MKKNLIAVAVAAAFITPAVSMADATFYGHAQVEIGSVTYDKNATYKDGAGVAQPSNDGVDVVDNARGRVGFKASEDLGDGLTGLAKFEFKADTADGTSSNSTDASLTGRETMVGLKGSFGQIELGRLKAAYKYTGGVKYDIFVTTLMEARGNGGMAKAEKTFAASGHSSFHSNAIGYRNAFGPVKLSLTYAPETAIGASTSDDNSMTASVLYAQGGIEGFVAITDSGDIQGSNDSYKALKVGGKFKTGAHSIMLQLENIDKDVSATDATTGAVTVTSTSPKYMFLAYQMKMGKNIFALSYGTFDPDSGNSKKEETYLALGVVHKFSKMTRLYGGYRATSDDADDQESVITVGLRKDFAS